MKNHPVAFLHLHNFLHARNNYEAVVLEKDTTKYNYIKKIEKQTIQDNDYYFLTTGQPFNCMPASSVHKLPSLTDKIPQIHRRKACLPD